MNIAHVYRRCEQVGACIEWQGALNTDGYPRGLVNGNNNAKLHREVFHLLRGYYPEVVRHTCDNKKCLHPEHLIDGNQLDNVKDRHERNRTHNQVSDIDIWIVRYLRRHGETYANIAKFMHITYKRVEYIMNKYVKEK